MNARNTLIQVLAAAVLGVAANAAMADDITMVNDRAVSTLTRAQVKADLQNAQAAGTLLHAGEFIGGETNKPVMSDLSREQVRAEFRAMPRLVASLYLAG
jgi:hypothetical protein